MSLRTTLGRLFPGVLSTDFPSLPPATHFQAPKKREDVLREANARTIERLKDMREGDPSALAEKRAATYVDPLVLKLPDDPEHRAEIEAAIRENFGRNTGLLQPGETRRTIAEIPHLFPGTKVDFGPDNFLIFINGDARTGKDTTASLIAEAFEERGFLSEMHSSIEPVRQMLLSAGIDVSAKNEKDRKLLAEIGDLTEDYNGFRSNYCVAHFLDMAKRADAERKGAALILHTREPHTIHKIAFLCRHVRNLNVQTLFISGRGVSVQTNRADAGVRGMVYDTTIANDGTIHDLAAKCESYVDALTRNL